MSNKVAIPEGKEIKIEGDVYYISRDQKRVHIVDAKGTPVFSTGKYLKDGSPNPNFSAVNSLSRLYSNCVRKGDLTKFREAMKAQEDKWLQKAVQASLKYRYEENPPTNDTTDYSASAKKLKRIK